MENPLIKCRKCSVDKPITEFFKASKTKKSTSTNDYVDKICRSCKHDAMQERRKAHKQWCVDYKGGKCIECGYNKCLAALDFHHLEPHEKEFKFRNDLRSKELIKPELDKCVLLCSNCHREVHAGIRDLAHVAIELKGFPNDGKLKQYIPKENADAVIKSLKSLPQYADDISFYDVAKP